MFQYGSCSHTERKAGIPLCNGKEETTGVKQSYGNDSQKGKRSFGNDTRLYGAGTVGGSSGASDGAGKDGDGGRTWISPRLLTTDHRLLLTMPDLDLSPAIHCVYLTHRILGAETVLR